MKGLLNKSDALPAIGLTLGIALVLQGSVTAYSTIQAAASTDDAPPTVSFAAQVMPIIEKSCISCHGGMDEGEVRVELGFDMTTYEGLMAGSEYGSVIEPGDPDESLLVEMIEAGDMPEDGDPLSPEEIEIIRTWIAEGANNN